MYEKEDDKVVLSETVETNEQGHSALADFLHEQTVSTMICGGAGGAHRIGKVSVDRQMRR